MPVSWEKVPVPREKTTVERCVQSKNTSLSSSRYQKEKEKFCKSKRYLSWNPLNRLDELRNTNSIHYF